MPSQLTLLVRSAIIYNLKSVPSSQIPIIRILSIRLLQIVNQYKLPIEIYLTDYYFDEWNDIFPCGLFRLSYNYGQRLQMTDQTHLCDSIQACI